MLTERNAALLVGDLASYVPAGYVRQTSLVEKLHTENALLNYSKKVCHAEEYGLLLSIRVWQFIHLGRPA